MDSHEIRVQTLDQTWETLGVDRARGITAEDISCSSNQQGSDSFSCTLRRESGSVWPDLAAYTPLEFYKDGLLVWSGRLSESPIKDGAERSVSLQAKGWQYHTDDDVLIRQYVTIDMGKFTDVRQHPSTNLSLWVAGPQASADNGSITLQYPTATYPASSICGVMMETPAGPGVDTVWVDFDTSANAAGMNFYIIASDVPDFAAAPASRYTVHLSQVVNTAAVLHTSGPLTARKYLIFALGFAAGGTLTADVWVKIKSIRLFHAVSTSAFNSILYPDEVIKDVRDRALPLLSTDNSKILHPPTYGDTFPIPSLGSTEYQTPREYITQAMSFYDWQWRVDPYRRLELRPRPDHAKIDVGLWGGVEFDDSSAYAGEEIYNKVIIEATGIDGLPVNVVRTSSNISVPRHYPSAQVSNPSFDTNTTGWTAVAGTLTRDTVTYDSSPASGKMTTGAGFYAQVKITIPSQIVGQTYTVAIKGRRTSSSYTYNPIVTVLNGSETRNLVSQGFAAPGSWIEHSLTYTAYETTQVLLISVNGVANGQDVAWIDSVRVMSNQTTIVDRRGFSRTKVLASGLALTTDAAQVVGDIFLRVHSRAQLKGNLNVVGSAGREALSGRSIPAAEWLLLPGERVCLCHRRDPDTGDFGREGLIESVTYSEASDSVSVAVDNERGNFEKLLTRLGARFETVYH